MDRRQTWAVKRLGRIRQSLGGKCQACGATDELHLHYTGPKDQRHHGMGTKGKAAFYTKAWRLGQLRLLCQCCHAIAHKAAKVITW